MGESSSSSDEEVKERLRSAVWDVKQPQRSLPLEVKETKNTRNQSTTLPPSLRASESDPDFNEEVGVVQASPELKSFVAKKLTRYLDGVIKEYAPNKVNPRSAECEDDFKLFSTSKHCDPADEVTSNSTTRRNQQHARNRRRTQDSSSDSDSDEENQKLASVAVSFNDVIHAQSILSAVAETKPPELIISDGHIANKTIPNGNDDSRNIDRQESSKKQKKKKRKQEKLENSDDEKCRTHNIPVTCKKEAGDIDSVEYEHINGNKNEDTSTLGIKKHKKKKKKKYKNDTNM